MSLLEQKLKQAFAKHQAGDIVAATTLYREVLAEQPDQPDAIHMLGVVAQQQGNPQLALKLIEISLAKKPNLALAWFNRALVLRVLGRAEEALISGRQAVELDGDIAAAWDLVGSLLVSLGSSEEARACLKRAVELQPNNISTLMNYAALLHAMGRLPEAYQVASRAHELDPAFMPVALGNILKASGYPEKAAELYKKAYEATPINETRVNEAMARLQMGDMERGWPLWETRPDVQELESIPLWRGEPTDHLLLYEFQGMGDALQCVRYLPLLRDRAKKITLQLTGNLQRLLTGQFPGVDVITTQDKAPVASARAQLMSLPYHCQTRIDTIPANTPYIHVHETWRAPWCERLKDRPRPRIGLVWGGNPQNRSDLHRSLVFSQLKPLLDVGRGHLISLQKGRDTEREAVESSGILNADPFLHDFSDTAGLMSELDLVISTCTSPVHLAGGMGIPVWMFTQFDADWRWFLGREDSPWYPTVRLFRQTKPYEWGAVIDRVAHELKNFIQGDTSLLTPKPWIGPPLRQNPYAVDLDRS